jgi:hypothetical protein
VGGCSLGYAFGAGEEVTNWIANFILGGAAMSDDPEVKMWCSGYRTGYGHGVFMTLVAVGGVGAVVWGLS